MPPKPEPAPALEKYSIVAHRQPVDSLLFALARDAKINLDIAPGIQGDVTLNAIDQTLPQLLERVSAQVPIRWTLNQGVLAVLPDTPYEVSYQVDYLNMTRQTRGAVTLSNSVNSSAGVGDKNAAGGSGSSTQLAATSDHMFWQRLESNLQALIGVSASSSGSQDRYTPPPPPSEPQNNKQQNSGFAPPAAIAAPPVSQDGKLVLIHPETGTLTVRASQREHRKIQEYLRLLQNAAKRQVMLEATVVEVALSDQYQAGIDWSRITSGSGMSFTTNFINGSLAQGPVAGLAYSDTDGLFGGQFNATLQMLETFGRTRVLSSPRVIALNNQTAVMKVVEEQVYFTIQLEEDRNTDGNVTDRTYTSTLHTVPVGLVMQVIPQIAENGMVLMNVRPTITNIAGYVEDPAVAIMSARSDTPVKSLVPILQVREFDSTLRIGSGDVAVLGGLIRDSVQNDRAGLPGISRIPWVGDLFSYRDDHVSKIELVIFLRPVVVDGDLPGSAIGRYAKLLPDDRFFSAPQDQEVSAYGSGVIRGVGR
ncbi:pilus (MSHA type) biogenesis protein MshL [Chitinibacteraceae bacterium HSL-7]